MNKLTILNNKNCRIDLATNPEAIRGLRKLLSWQDPNYIYSIAYKQNGWNGWSTLLSSKGQFPSGLQQKVEAYLMENKINFTLEDKRKTIEKVPELDISQKLKEINKEPRDYQIAALQTLIQHRKAIAKLATGAGKSLILLMLVAKLNKTSIIFVNSLSLLQQFYDFFIQVLGKDKVGKVGNGECIIKQFNIVSIWTAATALGLKSNIMVDDELSEKEVFKEQNKQEIHELLKTAKVICIDECHSSKCKTLKELYKAIDFEHLFSMSATPFSDENMELVLTGMLGERVVNVSAAELIAKKVLVQPIIKFVNVPSISIYGKTYAEVYNEYIVENDLRNLIILNQAKELIPKGYKPLILFRTINHGKLLFELFKKNGIPCDLVMGSSSLEKREEVKQAYNEDKIDVIIASSIFTIGIDIPKLNFLINASGNKGYILTTQKVGRVLRAYPGKNYAAVVDFIDNCRYLKSHSQARYKIYTSEPGFIVKIPPKAKL